MTRDKNMRIEHMKTLIIYCHPKTAGHNPLILEEITATLDKKGEEYKVLDLYHMKYDPVLHEEELEKQVISNENKQIQKLIHDTEKLIFIYPIWWGTVPALLKGFIDKIFTAGFAFKYVNGRPMGLLKGKKAAVFITSGSPKIFQVFLGHRYYKGMTRDILGFCGITSRVFHIDNAMKVDEKQKEKIRKEVKKGLLWLN